MINQIEPWIDDEEKEQLLRVINSTFVTESHLTKEFEAKVRELTGSKHAISMTNGTAALYCCLLSIGIGPGDEVIVPNLTFVATSNSVIWTGAVPIFCDVDENGCLSAEKLEKLIGPKTRAIMPVHLYGDAADMDKIMELAKRYSVYVVEDGAQGVGVYYRNKHVTTFGDCGILSFYGNKTITCGEGGIVITDDDDIAKKCYRLKNHGRDVKGSFIHDAVGYNFSFTEMQAAIGIAQLNKLQRIKNKKKLIYENYRDGLADITELKIQTYRDHCDPVHWFTSFFVNSNRSDLKRVLNQSGVQTRDFFYPLHMQPCYSNFNYNDAGFPVSKRLYETGISLPSSYHLTDEQQGKIIEVIRGFYGKQ